MIHSSRLNIRKRQLNKTKRANRRRLGLQNLEPRDLLAGDHGLILVGTGEGEGGNMQPSFTAVDPPAINEDAGAQFINGFATFDPGSAMESNQEVLAYQVFGVTNPNLFDSPPSINQQGRLTYTPAANAYGTSRFSVTVQDDGGTADGGMDTSELQSFFITVNAVNDAPTITVGDSVDVDEDSGFTSVNNFVTNFSVGPGGIGSEDGTQSGAFTIHDEGTDGEVDPLSTDNMNPTDLGTLNPGDNTVHGHVERANSVGDVDVFTFTIADGTQLDSLFVDAFDGGSDNRAFIAIDDTDSFPFNSGNINGGDTNEFIGGALFGTADATSGNDILAGIGSANGSGFTPPLGPGVYTFYIQQLGPATTYTLRLSVSQTSGQSFAGYTVAQLSDPSLFATEPAIDSNGNLTFTAADDAFGTATFEVFAQDDGGTANGGLDTSVGSTVTINIAPINDAPTFEIAGEVQVFEDADRQAISNYVTAFDAGPNESTVSTDFRILHDEGVDGTTDPLSTDNMNPSDVGPLSVGLNQVRGFLEPALSTGNVDVFTFTVEPGTLFDGLFVNEYEYQTPPANSNERNAFLAINDADSFPYNAIELDINNNPFLNESLFLGGTIFGLDDLPAENGGNILGRAGRITGRRFTPPLGPGTYTFYIQQTGPANFYALDLRVREATSQVPLAYAVDQISDESLFSSAPVINDEGELVFTPAADAFGTSTFVVTAQDSGGTDNGGIDTSSPLTGTITIEPINDAPTLTTMESISVLEDAGDQSIEDFVISFDVGPNESTAAGQQMGQQLTGYTVSNVSDPDLFASQPVVDINGTLSFTPAANVSGTATFEVFGRDNGGTFDGGVDQSNTVTVTIDIQGINDPPTFVAAELPNVIQGSGEQTIVEFATQFSPGPDDESGQMLVGYVVSDISEPAAFVSAPTVDSEGTLTYTLADDFSGTVTFRVAAQDDGGVEQGGVDVSTPQTITLVVEQLLDFGDAPDPYPVTLADDGARHAVSSLFLGAGVSNESDGLPSIAADSDDDDGIAPMLELFASDGLANVGTIEVTSSGDGLLSVWIDLDQDGDWNGADEQVITDLAVVAGTQLVSVEIPAGATSGTTFARYRLSTDTSLAPTGLASDGEVEDGVITLLDAATDTISPTFTITDTNASVTVVNDQLDLREGQDKRLVAPIASVESLTLLGNSSDDTFTLRDSSGPDEVGFADLAQGLTIRGGDGVDSIDIADADTIQLDITADGSLAIEGIEIISMMNGAADTLRIDSASVAANLDASGTGEPLLRIELDKDDLIDFADAEAWTIGDGEFVDGQFTFTASAGDDGPAVQYVPENIWSNVIRASDVNNNGEITAGDALVIINELARNTYSDPDTGVLVAADEIAEFPDIFFDQNGDGSATALDALRVINELARIAGEPEAVEYERVTIESVKTVDQAIQETVSEMAREKKISSFDWV